jgi:hypothetical protein
MTDQNNERRCIHCDKPDCSTPPMYDTPMCQNCWTDHSPEGLRWAYEYHEWERWHDDMRHYEEQSHPDYIDESKECY